MRRELLPVKDGAKRGPLKSVPFAETINDPISSPTEASSTANVCPSCADSLASQAILCTRCGYNRVTGRRLTTVVERAEEQESGRGADGRGFAYLNKQPSVVALGWIALYVGLFWLAATWSPYFILVHLAFLAIHGLLIAIRTIRIVFEDGILEGVFTCLLSRIIPYYSTYYVFSKTDNPHLKWANIAIVIGIILLFLLLVLADYYESLPLEVCSGDALCVRS